MKRILWISGLLLEVHLLTQSDTLMKLWYDHVAKQGVEALPSGNGYLGDRVFSLILVKAFYQIPKIKNPWILKKPNSTLFLLGKAIFIRFSQNQIKSILLFL